MREGDVINGGEQLLRSPQVKVNKKKKNGEGIRGWLMQGEVEGEGRGRGRVKYQDLYIVPTLAVPIQ